MDCTNTHGIIIKMSDITIISHKRSSNFTIVPNHIINADYLKLEDKAFLIWVLSKPEDWKLNTLGLAKIHGCCKDKITGISKRLQKSGHLFIKRANNGHVQWFVFENIEDNNQYTSVTPIPKPHPEKQDKPHPEKPDQGKQDALLRTDPIIRIDPLAQAQNKNEIEIVDYDNTTLNNLVLDDEFEAMAGMGGFTGDIENEFFKFMGHHRSKGTGFTNRSRWLGAWQKWIGTAKGFQTAKQQTRQTQQDDITKSLDSTDWAKDFNNQGRIIK